MIAPAVAGGLILGGSGLLSSGKGKKGSDNEGTEGLNQAALLQAQIAEQLFTQTEPLRGLLLGSPGIPAAETQPQLARIDRILGRGGELVERDTGDDVGSSEVLRQLTPGRRAQLEAERAGLLGAGGTPAQPGLLPDFLATGTLPPALQADIPFTGAREALEQQFQNVDEATIASIGARGGRLQDLQAENQRRRAIAIGDLDLQEGLQESTIRQNLFAQSLGAALGTPPQSIAGLSGAGANFGTLANITSREQLAQGQALGSTVGLATKLALKGGGGGGAALAGGGPAVGGGVTSGILMPGLGAAVQ